MNLFCLIGLKLQKKIFVNAISEIDMKKQCLKLFLFVLMFQIKGHIFAQIPNKLISPNKLETLPKLDRVETGKPVKQNSNNSNFQQTEIIKQKGPYLSEVDVLNRSQADGKVSPQEKKLIDLARSMPQTE
jgi:hypothetical protein